MTKNFEHRGKARMPLDKTGDEQVRALVNKVLRMKPGWSFFVEDVEPSDLEFLRRHVVKEKAGIRIVGVDVDEIYQTNGVRVYREQGEYDEL